MEDRRWGYSLEDEVNANDHKLRRSARCVVVEDNEEMNPYILESMAYEYLMEEMFDIINRRDEPEAGPDGVYNEQGKYFRKSGNYEKW